MDHSAHDAIGLLKRKFGGCVISGSGPVDLFLDCYVKSWVDANKATTLVEVRANIERKISRSLSPKGVNKSLKNRDGCMNNVEFH